MTPDDVYKEWRDSLKTPDDSIFYYHKSLDRIILGLAIFVIASRPVVGKLGKAEMMKVLHLQVPRLITYWIDGDGEEFSTLFPRVMTACEAYAYAARAAEREYPSARRAIRTMSYLLCHACGAGGDMTPQLAEALLDDITTDGHRIESDKIKTFGEDLFLLTRQHGIDIPYDKFQTLCGW